MVLFFLRVFFLSFFFIILCKRGGVSFYKHTKEKKKNCILCFKYIYMLHKVTFLFSLNSLKPCN